MKALRLLSSVLCLLCTASAAHALLGDTLATITKHRGKPSGQPSAQRAVWLFEGNEGQLLYSVTFGPDGRSIAEGLKPVKNAKFDRVFAEDFIKAQIATIRDSQTLRSVPNGEKYTFAGQQFVVANDETVVVDQVNGVLIVWNQSLTPSVMALTPAALR